MRKEDNHARLGRRAFWLQGKTDLALVEAVYQARSLTITNK
jgi:hypothetical protein